MTNHLTSRAQRLIDEFEEGESVRHGIAKVLTHLAYAFDVYCVGEYESMIGVPVSTLEELAAELTAPDLLTRALGGDKEAARQFLHEAGFTDKHGKLRPPYCSEDLDG
jgi:hypothetical protein